MWLEEAEAPIAGILTNRFVNQHSLIHEHLCSILHLFLKMFLSAANYLVKDVWHIFMKIFTV